MAIGAIALFLVLTFISYSAATPEKPAFTVGWSVYVGWNPYYYMTRSGIMKKWADKYGIAIKVQRFDYAPSLEAFVAKNIDACAMTNMEALDMPAASGVDTTAVIVGDYSNGNDAVLTRNGVTLKTLPGKKLLLVEKTVSQYLFERGMAMNGMESQIKRVQLVNTSDSDIAAAFMSDKSHEAVVTWKPLVSQISKLPGVTNIFNSSQIPGEILDLTVIRTDVLNRADGSGQRFAKALAGAWYETMAVMSGRGAATEKALTVMAEGSQDSLTSYKEQLGTTHMLYTPGSGLDLATSADMKQKMTLVKQFCFSHGLLGEHTGSIDDVAIRYPDGSVQGKQDRVRLRFETAYMKMAAQGAL